MTCWEWGFERNGKEKRSPAANERQVADCSFC
jgi:hypothetical protein